MVKRTNTSLRRKCGRKHKDAILQTGNRLQNVYIVWVASLFLKNYDAIKKEFLELWMMSRISLSTFSTLNIVVYLRSPDAPQKSRDAPQNDNDTQAPFPWLPAQPTAPMTP